MDRRPRPKPEGTDSSFAEIFSQTRKPRIRNFDRSLGYGVGVLEHKPLQIGEIEIGAVVVFIV
jgi:hypothetical protein